MMDEMRNLQAQYIEGVETMEEADARRYYALLDADYGAEYRDRRMSQLMSRLRAIDGQARAEQRRKDEHAALTEAKRQFYEITDGWVANGAEVAWVMDGHAERWTYKGERLYQWGAGYRPTVYEMLEDAKRIDSEFQELLRKGANI